VYVVSFMLHGVRCKLYGQVGCSEERQSRGCESPSTFVRQAHAVKTDCNGSIWCGDMIYIHINRDRNLQSAMESVGQSESARLLPRFVIDYVTASARWTPFFFRTHHEAQRGT
jgi:hypothetical protein